LTKAVLLHPAYTHTHIALQQCGYVCVCVCVCVRVRVWSSFISSCVPYDASFTLALLNHGMCVWVCVGGDLVIVFSRAHPPLHKDTHPVTHTRLQAILHKSTFVRRRDRSRQHPQPTASTLWFLCCQITQLSSWLAFVCQIRMGAADSYDIQTCSGVARGEEPATFAFARAPSHAQCHTLSLSPPLPRPLPFTNARLCVGGCATLFTHTHTHTLHTHTHIHTHTRNARARARQTSVRPGRLLDRVRKEKRNKYRFAEFSCRDVYDSSHRRLCGGL
jgi:hypothetical protein